MTTIYLLNPAMAQYGYRHDDGSANQRVARKQIAFLREAMRTKSTDIRYVSGAADFGIETDDDDMRAAFDQAMNASCYRAMFIERFGYMSYADMMDPWALPLSPSLRHRSEEPPL